MITALCHSKLSRELEGMEDLLTSAVFGRLRYLRPQDALMPFLFRAHYANGEQALPLATQAEHARYTFWPWWQVDDCQGAEPDLVIDIDTAQGVRYRVLIEAKFRSPKSSEAEDSTAVPTDQLAREWDNLVRYCAHENRVPLFVYLTADFAIPVDDLIASEAEYRSKRSASDFPFRCAWLSWRHLGPALRTHDSPIAQDLVALVERLGLLFFGGIKAPTPPRFTWRYRQLVMPFSLDIPDLEKWRWTFCK